MYTEWMDFYLIAHNIERIVGFNHNCQQYVYVLPANIWNIDFYRYHLQLIWLKLTVLFWFVVLFLLWLLHLFEWDVVMVVLCDSWVPRNLSHLGDAAIDVKHQPLAYYLYWYLFQQNWRLLFFAIHCPMMAHFFSLPSTCMSMARFFHNLPMNEATGDIS